MPVVIRFFADVNAGSINSLLQVVDQKIATGVKEFTLLISTGGGTVLHGLSAYNYLKGVPAKFTTHNFGSVDSIGVILYCAGTERLCVPEARFLLHGVSAGFDAGRLEEKQIEERLKSLQSDTGNITKVIAANCAKTASEIAGAMADRTTLTPEQAKAWGLVHSVKSALYPAASELISITG